MDSLGKIYYHGKCFHGNREGVRHSQTSLKLYRKMRLFVPRGLLFAKFGSNLTVFFDLAFPICIDAHAPASSNAIAIDQRRLITPRKEAANAEQFADNFKNMDYVKVPTILWEYTTPQVLTMEYVPGIKINRIKALDQLGVDRKRLGRYAVESYLEQILSHGFSMLTRISPNIREGLLEVFYGVHEKDAEKVLQAMVQMGVLVPTGDMTAVRRTSQFFLNRAPRSTKKREKVATAELGFKKPLTKEEKIEKKKQHLAAIGEDLLAIAADQPFRFPATFTFVDFRKRWDRQSQAFYNLFRQADRVEKLAQTIQRLEQGDLKLLAETHPPPGDIGITFDGIGALEM
ncbi:UNVERIFIED_CONTAM: protein ACTIVITY OF BC1 COMPLEX kinase, chloroplastic [Sesamum angustifolium]|uniref:Protein ACTIVITY OF BC1 COMPLEX kinase, chloroplastic n=1 Tax=Sesamum angustifolium TaxID=2727405 RepID=A0AAW2KA67_9LAMI